MKKPPVVHCGDREIHERTGCGVPITDTVQVDSFNFDCERCAAGYRKWSRRNS